MTELPLSCRCGAVRGAVRGASPRRANRLVCYCDDCQAFAHFLGAADRTLDARGGTEIAQISSGRVVFRSGLDQLACIRLRPGGLLRWYAACCRTPIGNTLASRRLPFVGLIHTAFDAAGDRTREAQLGPIRARVHTRFARGDTGELAPNTRVPLRTLLRVLGIAIAARWDGDHRRSPFFDPPTGAPIAAPRVLGDQELHRARSASGAGATQRGNPD